MNYRKSGVTALLVLFLAMTAFAGDIEDNWNDFLHYIKIGRLDLAKGYAQAVLKENPDPVELLAISEQNPTGYSILLRVVETADDKELTDLAGKILAVIEKGKFARRANPKTIVQEVQRLASSTARGRLLAIKRLGNSGEYAIMYMLDAMADTTDKDELSNLIWGLARIGRSSIRPLVAALQTNDIAIKAEIINALGKIGYPQSLAYLKYVVENDKSTQLRKMAAESIKKIDPAALNISSAGLFYRLAENYYYHVESLSPAEDAAFANVWFWNEDMSRLYRKDVSRKYFYELMAMRNCEWALRADERTGEAVSLWQAAFFKAESASMPMPDYFGGSHPSAGVYATTIGPEYLHPVLARAVRDKNAFVALGAIEALATTAGEKSLLYRLGAVQPLVQALTFDDRAVRYSAAIAIAAAGPVETFAERYLVTKNLAEALGQNSPADTGNSTGKWDSSLADSYALRSAQVMLKLVESGNKVIDLSNARSSLISATGDSRKQIQILSSRILARLSSPDDQRAIARMAVDRTNAMDVRIAAFNSLAVSAKFNANLLEDETIDEIYSLISSEKTDADLRSAAAAAFGALNLPSGKVKNLILDQAKK